MKKPFVSAMVLGLTTLVLVVALTGCGGAPAVSPQEGGGTAASGGNPSTPEDFIGKWIWVKKANGDRGSGSTIAFSKEPSDEQYPVHYKVDDALGNSSGSTPWNLQQAANLFDQGGFTTDGTSMSFQRMYQQNGVWMSAPQPATTLQLTVKSKDIFVLERAGEFAREGSAEAAAFASGK